LTQTSDLQVNGVVKKDLTVEQTLTTRDIFLTDSSGNRSIELLGDEGDIRLLNAADCAEDFDIVESEDFEPGTVMVLNNEGRLCQSLGAYDTKVVGVISGAGGYKPGLVLDKVPDRKNRQPVALMGKVYCKVDAGQEPIEVGDLLTTA
jgi:hypothetical protein